MQLKLVLKLHQVLDTLIILHIQALLDFKQKIHTKENFKELKKECSVGLYINGSFEQEILGDVLFTAYGVSGFAILDISQRAVLALSQFYDVELRVNFFPKTNHK